MSAHPHLSPELHRLTGESLLLWGDGAVRRQALLDLLVAWDRGDEVELERIASRIDRAVVVGLDALGLPRDSGAAVEFSHYGRGWIGHVAKGLILQIDIEQVRHYIHLIQQPDRIFHTLVHESLHARAPLSPSWSAEARWQNGYEEGMVEGLARLVTRSKASIAVAEPSYEFYVQAYRALAVASGVEVERFWRALWSVPPGEIRERFAGTVDTVRQAHGHRQMADTHRARLRAVADRLFARGRSADRASVAMLARLWETAFT